MGSGQEIWQVLVWVNLQCVHWQQPPHIHAYDSQAGCSHSLLDHQFGKLQLLDALSCWKNPYRSRCLIKGILARVHAWWFRHSPEGHSCSSVSCTGGCPQGAHASPIEAYSGNLHILDAVQNSQQVTSMTIEDWHWAQEADPVLGLVITRLWDGILGKGQSKATDPPEVRQYRWERNHLLLKQGILYRWARSRESEETLLQLVLPAAQREVALRGHHDEVGHLCWEHMLDLMHDRFFWPCMAAQAKEHIGKCCLCLAFKAKQPKAPLKTSWPYIL